MVLRPGGPESRKHKELTEAQLEKCNQFSVPGLCNSLRLSFLLQTGSALVPTATPPQVPPVAQELGQRAHIPSPSASGSQRGAWAFCIQHAPQQRARRWLVVGAVAVCHSLSGRPSTTRGVATAAAFPPLHLSQLSRDYRTAPRELQFQTYRPEAQAACNGACTLCLWRLFYLRVSLG